MSVCVVSVSAVQVSYRVFCHCSQSKSQSLYASAALKRREAHAEKTSPVGLQVSLCAYKESE